MNYYTKLQLKQMNLPVKGPLARYLIHKIASGGYATYQDWWFNADEDAMDEFEAVIIFGCERVY